MRFDILTLFPDIFTSYFNASIMKRAQEAGKITITAHDIRQHAVNKHGQVDDKPYGGGVGMVMMFQPIYDTLQQVLTAKVKKKKIILFSPSGITFTQKMAREWSKLDQLVMICGHYEGIDERIMPYVDEKVSIGDYVLTGGELPAMIITDTVARLIPGVLGKDASSEDESFSKPGLLEYPQYTRPEKITLNGQELTVPDILLSGNHAKIAAWRNRQRKKKRH